MIKVFIVEDEPLLMNNLKKMIENTHTCFKVIGTAYDGEEALLKLDELNPDVIFTDIRMPIMDGLILIEKLKEKEMSILSIIVSGYEEFDYARKAMRLGVFDYLLKPLSYDVMLQLLNKLYNMVITNKRGNQLSLLEKLLYNPVEISLINKNLIASLFNFKSYYYAIICSGSYCIFTSSWSMLSVNFWEKNSLDALVAKHIHGEGSYWIFDGEHGNEKILIIGINEEEPMQISKFIKNVYFDLCCLEFPITFVIGFLGSSIEKIGKFIQESRISLTKNILFSKSCILFEQYDTAVNIKEEQYNQEWSSIEKIFTILIQNEQIEKLKQEILRLFNEYEKSCCRQLKLERLLKLILNIFYSNMDFIYESKTFETDIEINELICNSYSFKSLYNGLCLIIDELFLFKKTYNKENEDKLLIIDKVEQYIKSNYMKQINLQSLSHSFGFVAPYLSRLYKQVKEITPTEYIIQLRIKKVKELLTLNPPIVLKDIAEAVGFNNPFYLSRVFKSITGKSPSEYKMANGSK